MRSSVGGRQGEKLALPEPSESAPRVFGWSAFLRFWLSAVVLSNGHGSRAVGHLPRRSIAEVLALGVFLKMCSNLRLTDVLNLSYVIYEMLTAQTRHAPIYFSRYSMLMKTNRMPILWSRVVSTNSCIQKLKQRSPPIVMGLGPKQLFLLITPGVRATAEGCTQAKPSKPTLLRRSLHSDLPSHTLQ